MKSRFSAVLYVVCEGERGRLRAVRADPFCARELHERRWKSEALWGIISRFCRDLFCPEKDLV